MDDLDYLNFIEREESTKDDILYIPKIRFDRLYESQDVMDIVPGFPVNQKMKYDRAKMIQAIQNGMVLLILYAGDKDNWKGGRERVIYPMVLGINKNTKNELLRAWHLEGYSVSQRKETKKVWRLFKTSNIKSMMFTGHFYRLPPKGYKMNDRVMTEITIARADFNIIRRNQEALIKAGKIEREEEVKIEPKTLGVNKISVKNTGTVLDLKKPWDNEILKRNRKNPGDIKITILKLIVSNEYIAVLGVLGEVNSTVRVYENKNFLGSYKTIASFTGNKIPTSVRNISEFDLYIFERKL